MSGPRFARLAAAWFAVLVVAGLGLRWWVVRDRPLCGFMDNEDATAHVLVTCVAYTETPVSVHHFLPIFTLGRPTDKWVDDLPAAAAPDRHGNYYYTSFPPGGFVAPHVVIHSVLGRPVTPATLRRFNMGLHCLLVALTVGLLYRALAEVTADRAARVLGAVTAGVVLWCAREAVVSYTISYWGQQLYQPIFALQLICLCTRRVGVGFAALCVAGCLTEWTAFLVNAGVVGLGLLQYGVAGDRRGLLAAGVAAASTAAAGVLLIAWYTRVMPLEQYVANLAGRFATRRSDTGGALLALARGYVWSAGPFILLALFAVIPAARRLLNVAEYDGYVARLVTAYPQLTTVIGLTLWSLAENLLLTGHAVSYSYDRLKFIYLLAGLTAVLVARTNSRTLTCLVLTAGTLVLAHFAVTAKTRPAAERVWWHMDALFGALVRKAAPTGDELVFTNQDVRGSKVYYGRRNIVQLAARPNTPLETLPEVRDEVLARARAAGVTTAVVILAPDGMPGDADRIPTHGPRPPGVYRIDVTTGEATLLDLN